jgi:signal transduction histidine kinase
VSRIAERNGAREQGLPLGRPGIIRDIAPRKRVQHELDQRVRQHAAVAELGLRALQGGGLQALFVETVASVAATLDIELCVVMEAQPETGTLKMRAGAGLWKEGAFRNTILPSTRGFMGFHAMRARVPLVVADLASETRFLPCPFLLEHGIVSGVSVAIPCRGAVYGVLGAHSRSRRDYNRAHLSFLKLVAKVLAAAIERERDEAELRCQREQLQSLSRRLIEVQEAERRAIARELHDDFGQVLTAIRLNLQKRGRDPAESIQLVDEAIGRMRELAHALRPSMLDDLGLPAVLRWYVPREAKRAGLEVRLEIANLPRLPALLETTCFRLVQESLTNIARHAQARRVQVELLIRDRSLLLTVRDDGKGFDARAALRRTARGESQGLLGMKERVALAGGEIEIDSAPGRGTSVHARLSLPRANVGLVDHAGGIL